MDVISEFKKIAPYIAEQVKASLQGSESDEVVMALIHEGIVKFFEKQHQLFIQFLSFNDDQRKEFARYMYDAVKPLADEIKPTINPLYAAYCERTGKIGALNYITGR
ncbi:hypothetical protein [Tatumella sp. OPLPL6]|uniref:hypothetical protein n=1 Tax=Tatumella sp. OPLPL6 TaxID=1928657 RepID=UPI000C186DBE|nr:hypothetical protein [Tatumella sp. OPLPL6]PIJ42121.1 hypothetical protein BOM24_13130 [Tatumella sp. OPLPL6]